MKQKACGMMEKIIEVLIPMAHICIDLLIALTIARIVLTVIKIMARPNFIEVKEDRKIKENKINIDKDLEKYFNYKE